MLINVENRIWIILALLAIVFLGSACRIQSKSQALTGQPAEGTSSPAAEAHTLTVFAASSLKGPFDEIGKAFQKEHPQIEVQFNYAGSQQLAQQIQEGARADVFASANQKQMDLILAAGLAEPGDPVVFAHNRLVIIYPLDNPAAITQPQDLAKKGIRIILAAPEVPVGQYTQAFLDKASKEASFGAQYKEALLANVISLEDNVKAVLSKVALGEADAGIVYASDSSGQSSGKVGQVEIPPALNITADYTITSLRESPASILADQFITFTLSVEGQTILKNYGFTPAK
jgi:molybdate transport system substrate-binding protein